jgi:hypothetical protein
VADIRAFKREHELAPAEAAEAEGEAFIPGSDPDDQDLRAEDDALVAAALEAEREAAEEPTDDEPSEDESSDEGEDEEEGEGEGDDRPRRRRRGRRGGRGRRRRPRALEGTFDHGEEGYGLWLDPAVQDDPVYAEHWAGHRPVTVSVEPDRIVISRADEEAGEADDES